MKSMLNAYGTERLKLEYEQLFSNFAFNFNVRRYIEAAPSRKESSESAARAWIAAHGMALQVNPMRHTLKAPGLSDGDLTCDELLSSFAVNLKFAPLQHGLVGPW